MIVINFNNKSYMLELINGEHIDEAYQRLWKIILHRPTDGYTYEQLVDMSKLWYYKRRYNCRYSDTLERRVTKFIATDLS